MVTVHSWAPQLAASKEIYTVVCLGTNAVCLQSNVVVDPKYKVLKRSFLAQGRQFMDYGVQINCDFKWLISNQDTFLFHINWDLCSIG